MDKIIWKILYYSIYVFLYGLILHFFLFNIVNYSLWIDISIIWLWKEMLIVFFAVISIYVLISKKDFEFYKNYKHIFILEIVFVVLVLFWLLVNFLKWNVLSQFVMAFKYDFLWFMIFFIFFHIWTHFNWDLVKKIIKYYIIAIKIMLIVWMAWYFVISTKPWWIKYFWYDKSIIEWVVWQAPPAVYYTQMNHWYARNQFLFERPINYWFFLVAMWPLFYIFVLRRRKFADCRRRRLLFLLNVVSTFSRAAWWAWFIEVLILWFLDYRKNIKRYLYKVVLPLFLVMLAITIVWYKQIVVRYFSNSWHIALFVEWIHMFLKDPLFWRWASTAWPWSHRLCENWEKEICKEIAQINKDHQTTNLKWFNTENQFIQILVEFWIVWFLMWWLIYAYLNLVWFYYYFKTKKWLYENTDLWILVALSVWMIWLSIEWMVLHSFTDRMIVYPYMLIYWLYLWYFLKKNMLSNKK